MLMVVEQFTRWVEPFALRWGTTREIIAKLENEVFCRWGTPRFLLTDNRPQFHGRQWQRFCKNWGITGKPSTPYHPQSNYTEKTNRNLKFVLKAYVEEDHSSWDQHLPKFAFALRTAINDTTRYSPAVLNLGREPKWPLDRELEVGAYGEQGNPSQQGNELRMKLKFWGMQAKRNIENQQTSQ